MHLCKVTWARLNIADFFTVKCRIPQNIQVMDLYASVDILLPENIQGTGRPPP
jgi:hypothetical protein